MYSNDDNMILVKVIMVVVYISKKQFDWGLEEGLKVLGNLSSSKFK